MTTEFIPGSFVPGVTVHHMTEVTDWRRLGEAVAGANSDQQAEFLAGLAEAMSFGQPSYIADEVVKGNAMSAILDTLDSLVESIRIAESQRGWSS
jgi:hypothetical protein